MALLKRRGQYAFNERYMKVMTFFFLLFFYLFAVEALRMRGMECNRASDRFCGILWISPPDISLLLLYFNEILYTEKISENDEGICFGFGFVLVGGYFLKRAKTGASGIASRTRRECFPFPEMSLRSRAGAVRRRGWSVLKMHSHSMKSADANFSVGSGSAFLIWIFFSFIDSFFFIERSLFVAAPLALRARWRLRQLPSASVPSRLGGPLF